MNRLYQRLHLQPNAKPSEIRQAFLTAARQLHPDKQPGNENANEEFRMLKEAYDHLMATKKTNLTGIIVEPIPLTEWNKLELNDSEIVYQTRCRCGGQLSVSQDQLVSNNDGLVPCDNCSLYVQIV
ncbi:hypothetical protein GpartN1_g6692.t1 [Galdieria partita]|uniref:Diphthamide biosynthesis protein 4 n=1 Tax=Galdieria partita TaxID=83374 RepID=A0A9C7Q2A9_9RHOD|nr:hypothetical protein GpartN1_g6692.t1 [Galdieria partita]